MTIDVREGDLVFIDSSTGLIPARVVSVPNGLTPGGHVERLTHRAIEVQVTASRIGWRTGEILWISPGECVPRKAVRKRSGQYRIVGDWQFVGGSSR